MSCSSSENCSDKKFKLTYFNGRGKAEAIRYNFVYAKVPFEDHRMDQAEWPKIKPTTPVGQVPILEVTDKDGKSHIMCQSASLVRSTAAWFGLSGKKACETAHADEAFECLRDVADAASKATWEQDAAKKEQFFTTLNTDVIPRNFAFLEKHAQSHGAKNLAGGESFTYADLTLAALLDNLHRNKSVDWSAVESKYPGLISIQKAIEALEQFKTYLAARPETPF